MCCGPRLLHRGVRAGLSLRFNFNLSLERKGTKINISCPFPLTPPFCNAKEKEKEK